MNAYKANIGFSRTPVNVLLVGGFLGVVVASTGWAEEYQRGDAALVREARSPSPCDHGGVTVTMPPTSEPANIAYAGLEFQVELLVGDEIEVWRAGDGAELPWEAAMESHGSPVARWTADPATGPVVRVDLTDLIRRALKEKKASVDLVVRRIPAVEETVASLAFQTQVPPRMIYHLVRPDSRFGTAVEEALDPGF